MKFFDKQDFVERYLSFETAKGFYLVPAGLVIIYLSIFFIQYIIQGFAFIFGWYCFSEGLRKIFVNRIKQAAKKEELVLKRDPLRGDRFI
jgi:uncharacterized membrane protein